MKKDKTKNTNLKKENMHADFLVADRRSLSQSFVAEEN